MVCSDSLIFICNQKTFNTYMNHGNHEVDLSIIGLVPTSIKIQYKCSAIKPAILRTNTIATTYQALEEKIWFLPWRKILLADQLVFHACKWNCKGRYISYMVKIYSDHDSRLFFLKRKHDSNL